MEKEQLLKELEEKLKGIPREDREKLIELYEDLIDVAKENRQDHKELVDVATLEDDFVIPEIEIHTYRNTGRMILASVSLLLFNLIFVLGPAIAVGSVYLSFWIVSLCFVLSPIMVVTQVLAGGFTSMEFFLSIMLCGIGLAVGVGNHYFGKGLYKALMNYVKWNIQLVKGE
ncbi:hypothetical protein ACLM5H_09005 [Fredinandcohnia humi]